ncbi:MAG: hypothetical protein JXR03_13600 [Cyclobacteriaceae bacterium]
MYKTLTVRTGLVYLYAEKSYWKESYSSRKSVVILFESAEDPCRMTTGVE